MAAQSTKLQTALVVKYKDGLDKNGKEIIKKQRFSKVKVTASDQDLYDLAREVGKLLGKKLDEILREDENGITSA